MSTLSQCGLAAIMIAAVIIAILYLFSTETRSNEHYTGGCVAFPDPDYGQYSYAGCRCSRVGVPMNNGVRSQNSGLYSANFNQAYEQQRSV